MSASDELLTLAELAIGLAGFSGVVVAFAYRGDLETIDRLRFVALLSVAISTAIFAFVPFAFAQADLAEPLAWRCSSGLLLAWSIALAGLLGPRLRRTALSTGAAVPPLYLATLGTLSLVNIVLQGLNVVGSPFAPSPLPYVLGLLIWLVFAALVFGFLVLFRPRGPAA